MDESSTPIRNNILTFLKILCMICIIVYTIHNVVSYTFRYHFVMTNANMSHHNLLINATMSYHNLLINESMFYHNLIINETDKDITALYYRHPTSTRNSSYPFISGDTFRAFADYVFDETGRDNLASVKYGDIIFVKPDILLQFFDAPFKSINTSFVLVTHNSDYPMPGGYIDKLADKKILAWYATNADRRGHPKLFPVPAGLTNTFLPCGNLPKITYAFENYRKPWANRTTLIYVSFTVRNNKVEREAALAQASKLENVTISTTKIAFDDYLKQIGNTKFVLSPPGNGVDCHRTWEALLMGAVPIIRSSTLDPLFNGLPVVIINDWSHVTQHFLLSYNFSSNEKLMPVNLYARYWRDKLLKHRDVHS